MVGFKCVCVCVLAAMLAACGGMPMNELPGQKGLLAGICDRTPEVRNAILSAVGTADCAAVNSESLADVEYLGISGLTALRAGDFGDLSNLQTLHLQNNQFATLPNGVFDGLDSLQTLYLHGNNLTELPPGIFDELGDLQTLWLKHGLNQAS